MNRALRVQKSMKEEGEITNADNRGCVEQGIGGLLSVLMAPIAAPTGSKRQSLVSLGNDVSKRQKVLQKSPADHLDITRVGTPMFVAA